MYVVAYIETETHATSYEIKDSFELRQDRGHLWIQKMCFWALRKLGCHSMGEKIAYTRHRIDGTDLVERLYKQYHGVL